ncbi:class I glutamine amidotransferase-like protein [Dendrothele bispora CBS 962.96]|uniref:Class I glutamine amidotransferase-like protein n=1 Tax=Dendrothele bispora (strain CBS 962.96) TaxID=1314807 RepID=A0A4S8MCM8_DENBC|nr:class I glutamine amidotransferase-like protein [Dendrothele bispora CBS 962.96]
MAVCLYHHMTVLDYQGPTEMLTTYSTTLRKNYGSLFQSFPESAIDAEFLSHTNEPVEPLIGPKVIPTGTYKEAMESGKQYDIVMIPGGNGNPQNVDPSLLEFLKKQYPKAKHVLTICTGSWILAGTGLLNGQKATTNKIMFKIIQESTKDLNITWVPKARWVVTDDKKIWMSSGITAGMDLANAFMEYFVGKKFAYEACKGLELTPREQGDDEWAAVNGLV